MTPKDVCVLIPGTMNVTLYGKRCFMGVIKLRILEYPGVSWWPGF